MLDCRFVWLIVFSCFSLGDLKFLCPVHIQCSTALKLPVFPAPIVQRSALLQPPVPPWATAPPPSHSQTGTLPGTLYIRYREPPTISTPTKNKFRKNYFKGSIKCLGQVSGFQIKVIEHNISVTVIACHRIVSLLIDRWQQQEETCFG